MLRNGIEDRPLLEVPASSRFVFVLTAFSALGGFLFGYDTGVVSGAMLLLQKQYSLVNWQEEAIVAITVAGAIVGALGGGSLTSRFGRRPVIMGAAVIFTAGALMMAAADGWKMLLVGRAVVGLGIGLVSMTIPMYIAETSPPELRGRLIVVNNVFLTGGQFVAGIVDGAFGGVHEGWRYMLGLAALPAILQFAGFVFLPESPRWLMSKGREEEARRVLARIRATSDVNDELDDIRTSFGSSAALKRDLWSDFKTMPALRRALLVGCGLQVIQQLVGINTVMYYSATIMKQAGITSDSLAIWLAAAIAGGNFAFTLVGMYFVERSGRRKLLLASILGVIFSLGLLGFSFYRAELHSPMLTANDPGCHYQTCHSCVQHSHCGFCPDPDVPLTPRFGGSCMHVPDAQTTPASCLHGYAFDYCPSKSSWLAILALVLYIACFAPGLGPMPWAVNAEIYPPEYRSFGNSCATAVNWTGNLIISMTFLDLTYLVTEAGAFWLYAGFAILGAMFVYRLLPETKGRSLEEIQVLFGGSPATATAARLNS
eukprot:m.54604 g.54604  ORF g.54604 m.54604 type:complete len:542 (-) comp6855_c0_seq2:34-1659(-)